VLAAGALLRGYYLLRYRDVLPFWEVPLSDAEVYHTLARSLSFGDIADPDLTYRPFLYPLWLGGVYATAGTNPAVVFALQAGFGLATIGVVYAAGVRVFGFGVGIGAAALLAFYGPMLTAESKLLDTAMSTLLHAASVATVLVARRGRGGLVAGVLLGLAAVARPTLWLVAGVAILWLWRARSRRVAVAALAGLCVPLLAAAALNVRATGRPTPLPRNGGATFYAGNNARASGGYQVPPGFTGAARSQEAEERTLAGSPWSLAFSWIAENPADAVVLVAKKLWRFAMANEVPLEYDPEREREALPFLFLLPVSFALLFVGALVGATLRFRDTHTRLLLAVLAIHLASALAFFVTSRYRMPAAPVCAWLAALGVHALWVSWRAGARRRSAVSLLACAAAVAALSWNPLDTSKTSGVRGALSAVSEGIALERVGRFANAEAKLQEAVSLAPKMGEAWLELGNLYVRAGAIPKARRAYDEVLRTQPGHPLAHLNLGITYLRSANGDLDRAREHLTRSEAASPSPDSALQLGNAARAVGDYENARAWYKRAIAREPTSAQAWNNLGVTEWELAEERRPVEHARLERAVVAFERALHYGSLAAAKNATSLFQRYAGARPAPSR
jgi:Flp pilus assembly protein TadD